MLLIGKRKHMQVSDSLSSFSCSPMSSHECLVVFALVDLQGCHATNDAMAESVFGAYKYERRRLPGISQRRASGLAQSRIMKSLARGDYGKN